MAWYVGKQRENFTFTLRLSDRVKMQNTASKFLIVAT
jgi:hypothetical protein